MSSHFRPARWLWEQLPLLCLWAAPPTWELSQVWQMLLHVEQTAGVAMQQRSTALLLLGDDSATRPATWADSILGALCTSAFRHLLYTLVRGLRC